MWSGRDGDAQRWWKCQCTGKMEDWGGLMLYSDFMKILAFENGKTDNDV
jgi:hypothetical protein